MNYYLKAQRRRVGERYKNGYQKYASTDTRKNGLLFPFHCYPSSLIIERLSSFLLVYFLMTLSMKTNYFFDVANNQQNVKSYRQGKIIMIKFHTRAKATITVNKIIIIIVLRILHRITNLKPTEFIFLTPTHILCSINVRKEYKITFIR